MIRFAAAALLLLVLPAAAQAGRVERHRVVTHSDQRTGEPVAYGFTLTYAASAGAGSRIEIAAGRTAVTVFDSAGVEAGPGCEALAPDRARCAGAMEGARVDAGDGDDVVEVLAPWRVELDAGAGDDRVTGDGTLRGGDGDDVLRARERDTSLIGGEGADALLGGPGQDMAIYSEKEAPVHADLEGDADDGVAGEGDRIDSAVDGLTGGRAADELVGDDTPNAVHGGEEDAPAADTIVLGGGDDEATADGDDVVRGGGGRDRIQVRGAPGRAPAGVVDGGPGGDRLSGTIYAERYVGGPGRDAFDTLGGGDEIDAVDGGRDLVGCADGDRAPSTATLDATDWAGECGTIRRAAPARAIAVFGSYESVHVGCPADHGRRCRVRLRVKQGRRVLSDRRLTMRPGALREVALRGGRARGPRPRVRLETRDASGRRVVTTEPMPRDLPDITGPAPPPGS